MAHLVQTSLGVVKVTPTCSDHFYTESTDPITVHRVSYHVSLHLFWTQHGWGPKDVFSFSARRIDKPSEDASPAARKVIVDVLSRELSVWAFMNPKLFEEAQKAAVSEEISRIDEEIEETEKKLEVLKDKRAELLKEDRPVASVRITPTVRRTI